MLKLEPSNQITERQTQSYLMLLSLLSACVLTTGCSSSALTRLPAAFHRTQDIADLKNDADRETLDIGQTFGKSSNSAAEANYELVNSGDDDLQSAPAARMGHSLLQPKFRPKKPVPLPFPVGQESDDSDLLKASSTSAAETPWRTEVAPKKTDEASSRPQPSAETGSGKSQLPAELERPRPENGQAENSETSVEPPAVQRNVRSVSLQQSAPTRRLRTSTAEPRKSPLIGQEATFRKSTRQAGSDVPEEPRGTANGDDAESEIPALGEPSMLDRFRNLYAPKPEESADRQRRSNRRWTDPFGLLKEREESVEPQEPSRPSAADADSEMSSAEPDAGRQKKREAQLENAVAGTPESALNTCVAELEKELRNWPGAESGKPDRPEEWRRRQTDLRMLYLISGRSAESVRIIESLPAEEQEFWQAMMMAANHYRKADETTSRAVQISEAVNQVRAAARHLQPLAKLELYRLQFCSRIDGFGNVTAFPTSDFEPGQRLLLYAGIRNFRSEVTAEGHYRTEFAAVIEFRREEDGEVLETIRLPEILDECDEERTDYFQSFELTAPALEGAYFVRIQVRDQLTLQTAESQLKINIR